MKTLDENGDVVDRPVPPEWTHDTIDHVAAIETPQDIARIVWDATEGMRGGYDGQDKPYRRATWDEVDHDMWVRTPDHIIRTREVSQRLFDALAARLAEWQSQYHEQYRKAAKLTAENAALAARLAAAEAERGALVAAFHELAEHVPDAKEPGEPEFSIAVDFGVEHIIFPPHRIDGVTDGSDDDERE